MSKRYMDFKNNKRREFIKKSILIAGASTIVPSISYSKNNLKNIETDTIIGHGEYKYKVDKGWGIQDPSRIPINDCHEMVLDKSGRIFMTTTGIQNNNIVIYDQGGKVLDSWGKNFPGAHGLTISNEGEEEFLWITDPERHKVFKTNLNGDILMTINTPKEIKEYTKEDLFKPTETTIGPNGDIYIADGYGENYIIQYTEKGEYIRHFGGKGDGAAEFDCCHGITLDTRNPENLTMLITSRAKQEFKRFTLDGEYIETIPLPGCSICRPVLHGDNLFFAVIVTKSWWAYDGILAILNKSNKVISFPGGSEPIYDNGRLEEPTYDGQTFLNPHDVLVDNDENLYVPQWYSGKTYPVKLYRV